MSPQISEYETFDNFIRCAISPKVYDILNEFNDFVESPDGDIDTKKYKLDLYTSLGFLVKYWDEEYVSNTYEVTSNGAFVSCVFQEVRRRRTESTPHYDKDFPSCLWCKNQNISMDQIPYDEPTICKLHYMTKRKIDMEYMVK